MSQFIRSLPVILGSVLLIGVFAACSPSQATTTAPTSAPATIVQSQVTTAPSTAAVNPTTAATTAAANPTAAATGTAANDGDAAAIQKINLNTATAQEILTIPNTGNRMVREFQEYRPYTSILQFRREIGKYVDAQTVAAYEQYVYVPIDVNAADADTLQQIPGLDANKAAQLIAARPFASNDAFLSALSGLISADDLAVAQQYLAGA